MVSSGSAGGAVVLWQTSLSCGLAASEGLGGGKGREGCFCVHDDLILLLLGSVFSGQRRPSAGGDKAASQVQESCDGR